MSSIIDLSINYAWRFAVTANTTTRLWMKNLPALLNDSSYVDQFNKS